MAPDEPVGSLSIGVLFYEMGKIDDAIEWYEEALKIVLKRNPKGGSLVYYDLAHAYSQKDDSERAKEYYEEALKRDRYLFEAWLNLGILYYSEGEIERAVQCLTRSVKLRPKDLEVRIALGNAYKASGNWKKALKQFKQALCLMSARDERRVTIEYLVRDLQRRFSD